MSSYHSGFSYLDKNSTDEGFIIASFEADSGFVDTFLGMDQITTDSYDGTKKNMYGAKYNTTATISITLIKADNSDFSVADNRRVLRWLTGNRQASWLDLYCGKNFAYSFLCSPTATQQYKMDGRVVGIKIDFTSLTPWAYSAPQHFSGYIGEGMLEINTEDVVYKGGDEAMLGVDENGVLYNDENDETKFFGMDENGYMDSSELGSMYIDNQTDDLYTYINLDVQYQNGTCTTMSIINSTLDEKTVINNVSAYENISLSSGQFIISDIPNKIFGDSFNFVWPRLCPGINIISIDGDGKGYVEFTYRYPIKIGDCAIDDLCVGYGCEDNTPDDDNTTDNNGDDMPGGNDGNVPDNDKKIITFSVYGYVNSTKYRAEEGMTWEEFIDSGYNPDDMEFGHIFMLSNNIVTYQSEIQDDITPIYSPLGYFEDIEDEDSGDVFTVFTSAKPTDTIIADYVYEIEI